ncbi:MAG: hypothetical protein ACE5J4_03010 [Candidatus Aenigmatarchaeota archaeon]
MKAFAIETMAMVVLAIMVLGVLYLWFSGEAKVQPAALTPKKIGCDNHLDCSENPDGKYCISIQNSPTFCGCIDDSDCDIGFCVNNKCSVE